MRESADKSIIEGAVTAAGRVLVVDDESTIRELLGMVLSEEGHEVVSCSTVSEAMTLCAGGDFDVLVCDYGLEDGDGISLQRALSRKASPLAASMILITGEMVDGVVGTFARETGLRTLQKPFAMEELVSLVAELMRSGPRRGGLAPR